MVAANEGDPPEGIKAIPGRDSNLLTVPRYSGEPGAFGGFKWRFEKFLELADAPRVRKFSETEKLVILERALPERERKRLIHGMQTKKTLTLQQFLRDMENLLATSNESRSTKKWNELSLRYGGRITIDDLVNFETDFECVRYDLPHLTEGECLRHLLTKLPSQLVNYVHEEEARLHLTYPQVVVTIPRDSPDQTAFVKVMEAFLGVKIQKA
jgi:hypothetical protein